LQAKRKKLQEIKNIVAFAESEAELRRKNEFAVSNILLWVILMAKVGDETSPLIMA
jgi:hypothetical protein